MPQLTSVQKREITERLGYRLEPLEGRPHHALIGPDGRHRGIFLPSKATELWVWNDAVFAFELYLDRDGAVHRRLPGASGLGVALERVWPGEPTQHEPSAEEFERGYVRLGALPSL